MGRKKLTNIEEIYVHVRMCMRAYFRERTTANEEGKHFLDVLRGVDKHLSYFSVPLSKTFHIHFPRRVHMFTRSRVKNEYETRPE